MIAAFVRATRVLVLAGALAGPARAQDVTPASAAPTSAPAAPTLEVYVVTFGQGELVWERFGHNALWLRDPGTGEDIAYHWGVFDFEQPNFVMRFLTGETRYWMDGFDPGAMFRAYQDYDRTTTVQRLALTPAQAGLLRARLRWNAREENRYYRYDYFRDNCSTRLRDVVDAVTGGAVRRATADSLTAWTWRGETLRLVDGMPWTQAGMHVALGHPADQRMTRWDAAFVPMRLRDALRDVRVDGRALVAEERVVYESRRAPEATMPRGLVPRFLVAGLLVAALLVGGGVLAARAGGAAAGRALLGVVGTLWGLVPGLAGVALLLAWTATRHDFWDRNENLFQLGPQSLPLVVLVPLAVLGPRWRGVARHWAVAVAAFAGLGLLLDVLPAFDQPNLAVAALALPAHLALAWALGRLPRAAAGQSPG